MVCQMIQTGQHLSVWLIPFPIFQAQDFDPDVRQFCSIHWKQWLNLEKSSDFDPSPSQLKRFWGSAAISPSGVWGLGQSPSRQRLWCILDWKKNIFLNIRSQFSDNYLIVQIADHWIVFLWKWTHSSAVFLKRYCTPPLLDIMIKNRIVYQWSQMKNRKY